MYPDSSVHIVTWESIHNHGSLWYQHHKLRYQAFVVRQRWQVPHHNETEWDQFDTPAAVYVLVERAGNCAAACRLVPTTRPYMLGEIFSDLLPYVPPAAPDIWEASRIVVDHDLPVLDRRLILLRLISAIQNYGIERSIRCYLGLMSLPIWRLALIRNGVDVRLLKDTSRFVDGVLTIAGEIMVSRRIVERVQGLLEKQLLVA